MGWTEMILWVIFCAGMPLIVWVATRPRYHPPRPRKP